LAIPTNTFTTYTAIGNREDLIDVITNIAPTDAWFTSNSGTTRAKARYHEWLTDTLATPAANAVIEGDDATATAITPATRLGNYCQILRKTFAITDTQEVVDKAGRDSEINYQTANKLKELAMDIEYAMLINSASAVGATGTARTMKGLLGWIATNVTTGTGTGNEALTETMLNDNLALIWAAGGKPQHILCGGFQKRKIDAFTTNTRYVQADEAKLVSAVDVYRSSFGTIMVHLSTIMNTSAAGYVIVLGDMGLWRKAWLRPVKQEKLARTGASTKVMIEAELTLEARQELGSGIISQLTTS